MRSARPWLNTLRLAVLAVGIPILVLWASREQALDVEQGWSRTLLAGLVLSQCAIGLYALRFRTVLRIAGIELGLVETLRINLLSLFYQFFVPLSVGADVTKYLKLKARDSDPYARVAGIVLDHLVGLGSLLVIAGGLFVWRRPFELAADLTVSAVLVMTLMLAAAAVALSLARRRRFELRAMLARMWQQRGRLLQAVVLSFLMQAVLAAAVWVGSLGWQLQLGYTDILFVMTAAMVFQAVPLSIVGIGVAELAGTGLYLALGAPMSAAILLVSLLYAYRLFSAVAGGAWDLLPAALGRRSRAPAESS